MEEEQSNDHQTENQTEKTEPLESAATQTDLAEKSDNEQDLSAMEVE